MFVRRHNIALVQPCMEGIKTLKCFSEICRKNVHGIYLSVANSMVKLLREYLLSWSRHIKCFNEKRFGETGWKGLHSEVFIMFLESFREDSCRMADKHRPYHFYKRSIFAYIFHCVRNQSLKKSLSMKLITIDFLV